MIYEAVVLGAIGLGGALGQRSGTDRVDLIAGRHAEAVERQRVRGGIADRQVRVLRERLVAEQHDW